MKLEQKIESVLFWKGEPVAKKKLAEILKVTIEELNEAVNLLKQNLNDRGVVLLEENDQIVLGTNPELSGLMEELQKEELNRDLSKAALETLSIILYKKDGVGRAEIDFIRGVNSSFTLRMLSMRGLIERSTDPKDSRRYIYTPTFELLSYLGIKERNELPDFDEINKSIEVAGENLAEMIKDESSV